MSSYNRHNDVETLDDVCEQFVNGRELARNGEISRAHCKYMKVGEVHDYYEPTQGDKVQGKVVHKDSKEVHLRQSKADGGALHKFNILGEETDFDYSEDDDDEVLDEGVLDEVEAAVSPADKEFIAKFAKTIWSDFLNLRNQAKTNVKKDKTKLAEPSDLSGMNTDIAKVTPKEVG